MMEPKREFLPLGDDFPEPHMEPVKVSEAARLAREIDGERYGDVAAELRRLAAELSLWERLGDPHVLLAALKRGLPAQLTPEQVWHLAADDRVRLGDLEAEVEALRADAERYRWLRGNCECMGANADAAIDAAKASAA